MRRLKSRNLIYRNKIKTTPEYCKSNITFADLVTIFNEEAYKICRNRQISKLIALKTLQEFVRENTKNIKIVL